MIFWIYLLTLFNYLSDDPLANIDGLRMKGSRLDTCITSALFPLLNNFSEQEILSAISTVKEKKNHLC